MLCGLHRNSWLDHALRVVTVSGLAVASFWFAMQLQFLFSMKLGWLPLSGRIEGFPPEPITGLMVVDALISGDSEALSSALRHIVLPAMTLALPAAATVVRFTRNGVIGVINSPSVAYQTAMGLPRRLIVWKYVLRMALTATVTQLGLIFGILLAGAVVVETVFDWPGLGAYAVRSILQSDYNAVMGFTLCTGALFVFINLLVDMLQAAIDPRGAADGSGQALRPRQGRPARREPARPAGHRGDLRTLALALPQRRLRLPYRAAADAARARGPNGHRPHG